MRVTDEIIEEAIRGMLGEPGEFRPMWSHPFTERADIKIRSSVQLHDRIWMVKARIEEAGKANIGYDDICEIIEQSGIFLTQERLARAYERIRDRKIEDLLKEEE